MENNNDLKIPNEFTKIEKLNSEKEEFLKKAVELGMPADIDRNDINVVSGDDTDNTIIPFKNMLGYLYAVEIILSKEGQKELGIVSFTIYRNLVIDTDTKEKKVQIELFVEYKNSVKCFDSLDPSSPSFLSGVNKFLNQLADFLDNDGSEFNKRYPNVEDIMDKCVIILVNILAVAFAAINHSEGKRGTVALEFSPDAIETFNVTTTIF